MQTNNVVSLFADTDINQAITSRAMINLEGLQSMAVSVAYGPHEGSVKCAASDGIPPIPARSEPASRLPARRVGQQQYRRQVSWLSGRCMRPPSRFPSGVLASHSPITVAGAATALGLEPAPCSLNLSFRRTVIC